MTDSFSNIKEILNGVEFQSLNPAYAKVISDWNNIVGKKFADKSEAGDFFKKGTKLFLTINVNSSTVLQELSFFKANIIKKIKAKYNLEINDIMFKTLQKKTAVSSYSKPDIVQETYDIRPTAKELSKIILPDGELEKIKISVQNQPTLTETQKSRMLEIIITDLKTQEWMKQKGFPVCKQCGRVLTRKNFGEENLCQFCRKETNRK